MPARSILAHLRRPGGAARAWLGAVLALAIALKLLVPQGWMPDSRGGLMLCSGKVVPTSVAMPGMTHGQHDAPDQPAPEQPCAFAALGLAAAAPPPLAAVVAPIAPTETPPATIFAVAVGRGLAAPPPPATGPPAFA